MSKPYDDEAFKVILKAQEHEQEASRLTSEVVRLAARLSTECEQIKHFKEIITKLHKSLVIAKAVIYDEACVAPEFKEIIESDIQITKKFTETE